MHRPNRSSLVRHLSVSFVLAVLGFSAAGCLGINGSTQNRVEPTLGQQLQDLKTARDKGAISEPEYQAAKDKMLNGAGHHH